MAATALAGVILPHVHAAEDATIKLALVGCGGRGTGAVVDAFATSGGPVKLFAMADLFENRLQGSLKNLTNAAKDKVDVTPERSFLGFDAYKKAIDCLSPGDVVILTTSSVFRPLHFEYAVQKGVNVFMEKSFAVDAPGDAPHAEGGRGVGEEEPQGRLRLHVAALEGPPGSDPADPRRRDRRRPHAADLPRPRAGVLPEIPRRNQRTDLSNPAPRLLQLGHRRVLHRLALP